MTAILIFVRILYCNDGCVGQDLLAIVQDADQPRHYFPIIEERLKFKKLNAELKDYTSSSSVR